ncbi:MAG: hypothetical protein AB7E42_02010 [Anaerotignaceae bacterium]
MKNRSKSKNLGRCPNPLAFWKKQDQKLSLNPHKYAGLGGSRWQWQRYAICRSDSFAKQSADHTLVGV